MSEKLPFNEWLSHVEVIVRDRTQGRRGALSYATTREWEDEYENGSDPILAIRHNVSMSTAQLERAREVLAKFTRTNEPDYLEITRSIAAG